MTDMSEAVVPLLEPKGAKAEGGGLLMRGSRAELRHSPHETDNDTRRVEASAMIQRP
jgi:hypothetical protein